MITKDKLIQLIENLPENFSIDDIIEEFVLLSKIEQGLEDIKYGRAYSENEVAEKMEKWLKYFGPIKPTKTITIL